MRTDLGDPMTFFIPWTEDLAKLAIHPTALGAMTWLCGPNLRLDHAYGIRQNIGDGHELRLHGSAGFPIDQYQWHPFGRVTGGTCVASWVLTDQPANAGGFRCVPGSHKANFPWPGDLAEHEVQVQPELAAGDLLIFMEALIHGTLPWLAQHERRVLLFKYSPGSMAWLPPEVVRDQLAPFVETVGDTLRVLLEPPFWEGRLPGQY